MCFGFRRMVAHRRLPLPAVFILSQSGFPCHLACYGGSNWIENRSPIFKKPQRDCCGFLECDGCENSLGPGFEAVSKFIFRLVELDLLHRACAVAAGFDVGSKPTGFVRREIHPAFLGSNRIAGA